MNSYVYPLRNMSDFYTSWNDYGKYHYDPSDNMKYENGNIVIYDKDDNVKVRFEYCDNT